jgi:trans-aconitate methyltransferase
MQSATKIRRGSVHINPWRSLLPAARGAARAIGMFPRAHRIARSLGYGRPSATQYEELYNLNQLQAFEAALARHGYSLTQFSSILDFACGWGRLTQYLSQIAPQAHVFGCDIDEEAIEECRQRCPTGEFSTSGINPPLDYEDEQFDLIWSYSVFTSLSEPVHAAWLTELARKLSPGGVMLHTTHSYEYLKMAAMFSSESLEKYEFTESINSFIQSAPGYYYVPYSESTPDYGLAIISKEYVKTEWSKLTGLSVLDYQESAIEAHPEGCQDLVVLRKDSSPGV